MKAPINRFKKKKNSFLIQEIDRHKQEEGMPSFFKELFPKIRTYFFLGGVRSLFRLLTRE